MKTDRSAEGLLAHLGAVAKPPEEGERSGVAGPDHGRQVHLLVLDDHERSQELDVLNHTCGTQNKETALCLCRSGRECLKLFTNLLPPHPPLLHVDVV